MIFITKLYLSRVSFGDVAESEDTEVVNVPTLEEVLDVWCIQGGSVDVDL